MVASYKLQVVAQSDPGQVREHNEDSIASAVDLGLVVLADGMGGYNAGEVASAMVTSRMVEGVAALLPTLVEPTSSEIDADSRISAIESLLRDQLLSANAAIYDAAQKDARCEGMGTTVVACLFHQHLVTVLHVGDSRLYRLRGDELRAITRDHSLLQEQIDAGLITQEEAHLSNNKNLITRAVGVLPEVEPEVHTYAVEPDDIYMLCTDGLFGMVAEEEMQMTLSALRANLELTAGQLVQAANDMGGMDNVSLILVQVAES